MDDVPDCRWVRTKGGIAPTPPAPACRNGHTYRPYKVLVGSRHCDCSGQPHRVHITWTCRECDDTRACGLSVS